MRLLVCFVLFYLSAVSAAFDHSILLEDTLKYSLKWQVVGDEITLALEVNVRSWVAIGWHCVACSSDAQMTNSDVVVALFDAKSNIIAVEDRYAKENMVTPELDTDVRGTNDILQYSGFQTPGYTFFEFKRKITTNDTRADHPLVLGDMRIIWAHGREGDVAFGYHGSSPFTRGEKVVNFVTGATADTNILKLWHGSLMTIAWAFCLSFGVFTARYLKYYYWWFPLHTFTQSAGVILAIVGFSIAFIMSKGNHFSSLHSLFGLTVLSLAVFSATMGIMSHFLYDPKRQQVPWWPDRTHWWLGRIAVLLSYGTIILGMRQYGAPSAVIIVFSGTILLFFLIYVYLDVYRWKEKKDGRSMYDSTEYD